jgi:Trk-type K+ transport system membrane component
MALGNANGGTEDNQGRKMATKAQARVLVGIYTLTYALATCIGFYFFIRDWFSAIFATFIVFGVAGFACVPIASLMNLRFRRRARQRH